MGMVFSASTTVLADSTVPLIGGPTTATVRTTASEEAVARACRVNRVVRPAVVFLC